MSDHTLQEAASILGVSKETVRRKIKSGELRAHKAKGRHGREWIVTLDETGPDDTLPATVDASPVLGILTQLATKDDIENVIRAVDKTHQLTTERDALREQVEQLKRELAAGG